MSDTEKREADQDPAPLKHSDAERISEGDANDADSAQELEDDPSSNPPEGNLRDVKGG